MRRLWPALAGAIALVAASFAVFYVLRSHPGGERSGVSSKTAWQRMASPGPLSRAHAFLEHDCNACHTPYAGPQAAGCIACHANEEALLGRQPTAFHAAVTDCRPCHREHGPQGGEPTEMDHAALAALGVDRMRAADPAAAERLVALIGEADRIETPPGLSPAEAVLACAACHGREDPHVGFFGRDCAACHSVESWNIPSFRHPAAASTECSECHKAPPSHFMGHFHMVSMVVAGQPHARVEQCHLCHQTTSWNDIRSVGWYDHH